MFGVGPGAEPGAAGAEATNIEESLAPEDDLPDVATIPEEELGCRVTCGGNLWRPMVGMRSTGYCIYILYIYSIIYILLYIYFNIVYMIYIIYIVYYLYYLYYI